MTKRYSVQAPEIWMQWYNVDADSEQEARELVANGNGEPIDGPSYIDTIDSTVDEWLVLENPDISLDAD